MIKKPSRDVVRLGLLLLIIGIGFSGCAYTKGPYLGAPMGGGNPPVIKHSYAIEKGRYGDVLKIYIEAEDPDGDMLRVATVVDQVGYGRYPTDWIYLKKEFQGRFVGYLQWNTYSPNSRGLMEWTRVTLKVSVFDKAGNESNVVTFPYEFSLGQRPPDELPAPFDQKSLARLGGISVELLDPWLMDNRRERN